MLCHKQQEKTALHAVLVQREMQGGVRFQASDVSQNTLVSVVPVIPPSMLSPGARIHGRHDLQSHLHAPSSPTRCCRVGRLTLRVVLFTAVRKENCLPLKMLLVKTRRRAWRRQRGSLQPPGPPAAQSRGNYLLPAVLPRPCSGFVSWELGGRLSPWSGGTGPARAPAPKGHPGLCAAPQAGQGRPPVAPELAWEVEDLPLDHKDLRSALRRLNCSD
eukprot:bmy_15181T0